MPQHSPMFRGDRVPGSSPRDRYPLDAKRRLLASPWLRAVICGSKMVRDGIGARFPVSESKPHVVYDSVDTEAFHPGLRAEGARVIERHGIDAAASVYLMEAADFARANLGAAHDALAQIPGPVHLVAIGPDPQTTRDLTRAKACAAALPHAPMAITLQQVLLYRDLLAAAPRGGARDVARAHPGNTR